MISNLKKGLVTLGFLVIAMFFVVRNQNDVYDIRPTPLLIEIVSARSFDPAVPKSGGWFGAADVVQTEQEGQISGWIWPIRGHLRAYSSLVGLDLFQIRQIGIQRPDVELAKGGDKECRFSGLDFKFDVATYGQIECVVWTDGKSQDLLWKRTDSKCD